MRFVSRSLTALFLAALAVGLLAWAAQITLSAVEARAERDAPGGGAPRERVFAAEVIAVAPGTVTPVLEAFGTVRAVRTLELRASVGGRIVALSDDWVEGGAVAEGDVLLRIDPAEAEAAVDVAQADVASARAEARDAARGLDLARLELAGAEAQRDLQRQALTRQEDLVARGVGATASLEAATLSLSSAEQSVLTRRGALVAAEARVDTADLGVRRAEIALREARRDLDDHVLTAAFDGVLSEVTALRGGLVAPNERLGALIAPSDLEVAFRLSTAQHARLVGPDGGLVGAPVSAHLDVLGLEIATTGRVVREAPAVGEGRSGRLVYAALPDADGFRPGDFVRVAVEEPSLDGVATLPAAALSPDGSVLALGPDDRLEAVVVDVLRRQGDAVIVAAAPLAGREVIAARGPALGAGIRVRPLRSDDPAPDADATVTLDADRRARLVAFVEGGPMPDDVKARILAQLDADRVPVAVVERLERRMGG